MAEVLREKICLNQQQTGPYATSDSVKKSCLIYKFMLLTKSSNEYLDYKEKNPSHVQC